MKDTFIIFGDTIRCYSDSLAAWTKRGLVGEWHIPLRAVEHTAYIDHSSNTCPMILVFFFAFMYIVDGLKKSLINE